MIDKKQQGLCKIHNARFYNLTPRAINHTAYNAELCLLALTREDASIEIWNLEYAPYLKQTIVGTANASVESIGWVNNRLFSTGLTGELIEWDLEILQAKRRLLLTGNAAWCLDINKQNSHLVVGTDSGYINVFDVSTDDEVNYVKVFDRQEGKILCCKFDHSGEFVVTGSADTIRVWELKSGHAIYKMSTGRMEAKKETIVWSLAVLKDFTIIAGDSRGYITIWDGKLGSQIDSIQAMKLGDVLTVAISDDEKIFACAGVDPKIKLFAISEIKKGDKVLHKWVKFLQRSVHEHDVKTLQFIGTRIISGGVDGYLGQSYSSKAITGQTIVKYGPFLSQPCAIVAAEKRILLLKYLNYIELWKLAVPTENVKLVEDEHEKRKYFALEEGLHKLLELRAKGDATIVCSTISPNGKYLIYSTEDTIRLFQLTGQENRLTNLSKIKDLPDQFTPSTKCIFSADSQTIFLVKRNRQIDVFSISDNEIFYLETINTEKSLKGPISHINISDCGKYLVCAGLCCNISVWKRNKVHWRHHLNLPKYPLAAVAIAIHKNSPKLVVAFSDSKLFEYHLEEMKFLCSTIKHFVANQETHVIQNIVLDPRNENIFILHNDAFLFVLKKNEHTEPERNVKKSKLKSSEKTDENVTDLVCTRISNFEHLVNLCWMGESEMIAVGVNPVTLVEQLPSSLKEKQFGVS